jgi:hypothetical protein
MVMMMIMTIMIIMIVIIIIILSLLNIIINNGNLVLSFYCNFEIMDTESYDTNKSRPHS